ncbi:MAG: hypothetical protein HKN42_02585 [Granulosicoccus sp.]|nr:hypothetical protein [Granulosicoccus sp.]
MDNWQAFLRLDFADELMLVVGALLIIIGIVQIVRSSLKMLFWVVLACIGVISTSYGMQHSPYDLPALHSMQLSDIRELTPQLNSDVLEFLCQKLEAATR